MMNKVLNKPIAYLAIIVSIYTVYDYVEHISRKGSTFEEHPWYWLFFSLSALLSFILVVILVKNILQKLLDRKNLIIEVIAIGIWLVLYINVIGPFINTALWPFDALYFRFSFGPFAIILIGYFVIRILINLLFGKKALYSN